VFQKPDIGEPYFFVASEIEQVYDNRDSEQQERPEQCGVNKMHGLIEKHR
jgi:hypothetical protein